MNVAQRVAIAVTMVVVAVFLFVCAVPYLKYENVWSPVVVGMDILILGGAAVLLLGVKRKPKM